ncbi:nucleoside diphosphate-linked moiety X motif 17-like [Branchiostoma lanceolatum]|uniref:nucleoside diphosphate-linked moiety X motif 17-like n=1 Tax=Branchiostoma lanceolatum TaxID=7740 RepID=UPI003453E8D0
MFCPITHLSPETAASLPTNTLNRGVDVGVAVVLETKDQHVLLTRRARHMRTFPRVWVPPGGHVEKGETLLEAGRRELQEETGLHLPECHGDVLGLWESVFPPMLNLGLPKRHHIVVYVHLLTQQSQAVLQDRLELQASEVDGAAWLDRSLVEAITASDQEEEGVSSSSSSIPKTFRATVLNPDGQVQTEDMSTTLLMIPSLQARQDQERVSTGTKFALAQWIKCISGGKDGDKKQSPL